MDRKTIKDKDFGVGDKVSIDDTDFYNCKFKNAVLVFSGGGPSTFDRCTFDGVNWSLEGGAANTFEFLRQLYNSPFRPVIEQMVSSITGKTAVPRS